LGYEVPFNGQPVKTFAYTWSAGRQSGWMLDSRGTGYFFPEGGVQLFTAEQTSPNHKGGQSVTGQFATALFDHGTGAKDASYEYLLVADASADQMAHAMNWRSTNASGSSGQAARTRCRSS